MKDKQRRALEMLLEGHSIQQVCDEIGISRRTLERWRKIPEFAAEMPTQREYGEVSAKISGLIPKILAETEAIAFCDEARVADRLRALTTLGTWAGLDKIESEKTIEVPDEDFPGEEVWDGFQMLQGKLKSLASQQIIEGGNAETLSEIKESIDNLTAIMTEISRLNSLAIQERIFDDKIKVYTSISRNEVFDFRLREEEEKIREMLEKTWGDTNRSDEERGITPEQRRQAEEWADEMLGEEEEDDT